jgi:hypothetical protein
MRLVEHVRSWDLTAIKKQLSLSSVSIQEANEAFQEACTIGYVDAVRELLQDKRVDPTAPSFQAVQYSYAPSITNSFGLQQACYYGRKAVVDILLSDKRSDLSAGGYRCLKLILDKARDSYEHKQILLNLINHCQHGGYDYRKNMPKSLVDKIDKVLSAVGICVAQASWASNDVAAASNFIKSAS